MLTPYEKRLLALRVSGMRVKEIATLLGKAEQTIKNALCKIYKKTGVSDRYAYHHELAQQNQEVTS
jgi:DNA-binding NarL/FixJ family response regulator